MSYEEGCDCSERREDHIKLLNSLEEATKLIGYFVETSECNLDHHGYCQEHHGGFMDGGCWQPRAQAWLKGTT